MPPDRCGFIIVPTRWRQQPAFVLVSAGRDPAGESLDWMQAFARASGAPFYHQQGREGLGYEATINAIYELKGDVLRVCFARRGQPRPSGFDTQGKKSSVYEFKRAKADQTKE